MCRYCENQTNEKYEWNVQKKVVQLFSYHAFVLIIIATLFMLSSCGSEEDSLNIDISKYIIFTTEGSDGNGLIVAELDERALDSAIKTAIGNNKAPTENFVQEFNIEITPATQLSIGDIVSVEVTYNENIKNKLGINLINTNYTYEITELKEVEEIDPFQFLTITYESSSPCVMVNFNYEGKYLDSTCFKIVSINDKEDNTTFLKIGDRFVVEVIKTKEELSNKGCSVTKLQKEYTVTNNDVTSYAKSISEIKQDTLDGIKSDIEKMMRKQFGTALASINYKGCQMAYINDISQYAKSVGYTDGFPESANQLNVAYEIAIKADETSPETIWYVVVEVENVINTQNFEQSYKIVNKDYTRGDYSFVTLAGLKNSLDRYSSLYNVSYSVELQ